MIGALTHRTWKVVIGIALSPPLPLPRQPPPPPPPPGVPLQPPVLALVGPWSIDCGLVAGSTVRAQGDLVRNFSISFGDQSAGFFSFQTSPAQATLANTAVATKHSSQRFASD